MWSTKIGKLLKMISINSLIFNLRYFPLKIALRLPVFVSKRVKLQKLGGTVILEGAVSTGRIQIGYGNLGIFDSNRSRAVLDLNGTITFKGKAKIGHGSKISIGPNGCLILGDNFKISAESSIVAHEKIVFGNNCLLSWDILVMDTDFHIIRDVHNDDILNYPKPILIGDNVWIGCRSMILKGSEIPENSIVAAGSSINRRLTNEHSHGIFGGSPIRILKSGVKWQHEGDFQRQEY